MKNNTTTLSLSPVWYSTEHPKISIIILNFNKSHLTAECLKSIWQHTKDYYYEVIVIDNGSRSEEYLPLLHFRGEYKLIRLNENRFFGEGNNIGAEIAKGEYLVFLNNDVIVTPNWLAPLMRAFDEHSDCGAAGPKFIYPNGLLQEAGALLDEAGESVQIGKFQDPNSPRFNRQREVDYVSAATVLIKKTIFEKVLGFDFIYEPAYYEDVDLCLKIGQLGLKTYYVPESYVVHHENATTADPTNKIMLTNIVAINREKFVRRWASYLQTGTHLNSILDDIPVLRKEMDESKPTAAVFTPYNIIPAGGEKYLLATAEALIELGYQVSLVTPDPFSYIRLTKVASILSVNLQGLSMVTYQMASLQSAFDIFIAMGNEIAPPVKGLGKRNFYCCQFPFPCADQEIYRRKIWMGEYEAFVVYSDFVKSSIDKRLLQYSLPNLKINVIHPPVDMFNSDSNTRRKCILSVGRFFVGGHCKQQDALIKAFRKLYESGFDAELHLVGSLLPAAEHREYFLACNHLAQGLPVYFHMDASADELAKLYADASVYWHAAGFGVNTELAPEKCEHFGISVIEAMSAGVIPIVVNNGGPADTVQDKTNGFHYSSEAELIELTQKILIQSESALTQTREQAKARAKDFSKELFAQSWDVLLQK